MFNIGWGELLVIAVIVLFAFGPEDIPKIMYNFGRIMRRFRYMRFALTSQFEDFMEKAEAQGRAKGTIPPIPEVSGDDESEADQHLMTMLPTPIKPETPAEEKTDDRSSNPPAA